MSQKQVGWRLTVLLTTVLSLSHVTTAKNCNNSVMICKPGLLLPVWEPKINIPVGAVAYRAIVYFAWLCYFFLGVSIVSDRFMSAIEVITSKEREMKVTRPNGEIGTVYVKIWNGTVANLTLMALGSSAPEIFLSIIEICGSKFEAGDLGPGTIVGSAAYNLLVIVAICVVVVPSSEVRRIRQIGVFWVTVFWSIFAYVWLYLIIAVISAGVIDLWEGILTFLFFPLTVITSYWADKGWTPGKYLKKLFSRNTVTPLVNNMESLASSNGTKGRRVSINGELGGDVSDAGQNQLSYIEMFKSFRKRHPQASVEELETLVMAEILKTTRKSRAYYRVQANNKIFGGNMSIKRRIEEVESEVKSRKISNDPTQPPPELRVSFQPRHYICKEDVGKLLLNVICQRPDGCENKIVFVDYQTEDGEAKAHQHYMPTSGTLKFDEKELQQQIEVQIVDNDLYEEDKCFTVQLSNPRIQGIIGVDYQAVPNGNETPMSGGSQLAFVTLNNPPTATVMVLDNDRCGIFEFSSEKLDVLDTDKEAILKVNRLGGAKGRVKLPYKAVDGTAKGGLDFEPIASELQFEDEQTESVIKVPLLSAEQSRKNLSFTVILLDPKVDPSEIPKSAEHSPINGTRLPSSNGSGPSLGTFTRCKINFNEDEDVQRALNVINLAQRSFIFGTSNWTSQFKNAFRVNPDSDEGPTRFEYFMHVATVPWKLLFAFIPPAEMLGGWACFTGSIIFIGLLTAAIGDLASHFGCTVGLKDSVTAISFVALGTSLPDTFASKVAALSDDCADSSIGNVTGSNAVNVYLGIGVAWLLAAIYHSAVGTEFRVDPGSLAFSVTTFCVAAAICIALLQFRRFYPSIGGELGGPRPLQILTSFICVGLWAVYILLAGLEAYCIIEGF